MPNDFEFSRNHWAVKDVDLYRFLLRNIRPRRQRPTVFQISEHESIEPTLASAMMPFDVAFNPIYDSIREAADNVGLRCRRADDIWKMPRSFRMWSHLSIALASLSAIAPEEIQTYFTRQELRTRSDVM